MGGAPRVLLAAVITLAVSPLVSAQGPISWMTDAAQAQQLARQHQKLVLLHFWSPNCPPCRRLEQNVFKRSDVARAMMTNYVPVKVNVKENQQLATRFGISRWPTDVIVDVSGKELFRGVSQQDPIRFVGTLDQVAAHARLNMPTDSSASQLATRPREDSGHVTQTSGIEPNSPTGPYASPDDTRQARTQSQAGRSQSQFHPPTGPAPQMETYMPSDPPSQGYGGSFELPGARSSAMPLARRPNRTQQTPAQPAENPYVSSSRPGEAAPGYSGASGTSNAAWAAPSASRPAAAALAQRPALPENQPVARNNPATSRNLAQPSYEQRSGPPAQADTRAASPPTPGLEGYCPVTLAEQEQWVKGDPRWGVVHRGRVYLFAGPEQQQRFLKDFDRYAPVLSGYDPVLYAERGELADGKRAHGIFYRDRVYLFADETTLQRFWEAPERFAGNAMAERQRANSQTVR
jgi:thiol-disulfide isomerase/thioredoxin/YHS domain-containing protein